MNCSITVGKGTILRGQSSGGKGTQALEIRLVEKEEMEQANYVWSQAFRRGDRGESDWTDSTHGGSFVCGIWDEAGLQAVVVVNDFRVHLGAEVVAPMGGIGGVACLPASRGKGYAGDALKYSLEQMRERGIYLSALFPFSWDYYRRFGWEWVGMKRNYKVATRVLKADAETEKARLYRPEDRSAVIAVYTEYAQGYRGAMLRTEIAWNQILDSTEKQHTFTYVYQAESGIEGYLTYRGGSHDDTGIREFIALTPRAYRGLLGLLRRHEMQIKLFSWHAPSDDPLWSLFYHWDIETNLQPETQGRVVDVKAALEAWKPKQEANSSVILKIEDECAPWNTGTWRVECEARTVQVLPSEATPQVTMDIQAFSQAYYGTPGVDALRAADRLVVSDETGYGVFRALLDGPPMWMNDGF